MLTMPQVAGLLDIEPAHVQQLVTDRSIEPDADGRISLDQAICGYVSQLRDESQRASASAATARLQAAKFRAIELRNGKADGAMLDLAEHRYIYTDLMVRFKSALYGLPARISRNMEVRRRIEATFDSGMHRFSKELDALVAEGEAEEQAGPARSANVPLSS